MAGEGQDRSLALRLKGPPVETIKLDAEIDATDDLERPDVHPVAAELGIAPQLAVLETLLYPPSARLVANNSLQAVGTLEITPYEAPQPCQWLSRAHHGLRSPRRLDARLNPLRARSACPCAFRSTTRFDTKGGALYLMYPGEERLAQGAPAGAADAGPDGD
jgi:hypothetical protein